MAQDMVTVMAQLGFARFMVAGHDRGGRVACRMALDHPQSIEKLAVLDIVPTETVWERVDAAFALGYWPWSLLAQPEPLPERMLTAAADAIIDNALGGWGSPAAAFRPEVRTAYIEALQAPGHAHAICEEYRAAGSIDREHDRGDYARGHRLPARFWPYGAGAERSKAGTQRKVGLSRCGEAGLITCKGIRSMPGTSSRRKSPSRPPMPCIVSSAWTEQLSRRNQLQPGEE